MPTLDKDIGCRHAQVKPDLGPVYVIASKGGPKLDDVLNVVEN